MALCQNSQYPQGKIRFACRSLKAGCFAACGTGLAMR